MFKKLKSLFVVEEDVPDIDKQHENVASGKSAKSKSQEKTVKPANPITIDPEIFDSKLDGPVKPNKKFTDILLKAIEKSDLDGADYLEFKSSLKSLETVIDDEPTRYKSSFAVLKSSGGITKEKLLSTGDHYIKVLQKEQGKFDQTFQSQQEKQIKGRQDKIQTYQKGIIQKKEQLKKLISDIENMEKKLKDAKVEINQAASKVQLTKDQFMASYMMIVKQMEADFDKIKEYL